MAKSTKVTNNKKGSTQNPISMAEQSANVDVTPDIPAGIDWAKQLEKVAAFNKVAKGKGLVGVLDTFMGSDTLTTFIEGVVKGIDAENIKVFVDNCDTQLPDDIYIAGQSILSDAVTKNYRVGKNKSITVKTNAIIKAVVANLEKDSDDTLTVRPVFDTLVSYAGTAGVDGAEATVVAVALLLNGILCKSAELADSKNVEFIRKEDVVVGNVDNKEEEITFKEVVSAPVTDVVVVEGADVSATTDKETTPTGGIVSSISNEVYSRLAPAWKGLYAGREDELAKSINKAVSLKVDNVTGSELKDSDKFVDKYIGEIGDSVNRIMADNKAVVEAGESPVLEGNNDALIGKVVVAGIFDAIADNRQDMLNKLVNIVPDKFWENVASYVPEDLRDQALKGATVKDTREALSDTSSSVRRQVARSLAGQSVNVLKSLGVDGDGKAFSRQLGKTLATILTSRRGEGIRNTFKSVTENVKGLFSRFISIWDDCAEKPVVLGEVVDSKDTELSPKAKTLDSVISEIIVSHDNKKKAPASTTEDVMDKIYARLGRKDLIKKRRHSWK